MEADKKPSFETNLPFLAEAAPSVVVLLTILLKKTTQ
jgi:hypothetical protein